MRPEDGRTRPAARVAVDGKFFTLGGERFHFSGVTYGTFKPREDGARYPERGRIKRDFIDIADNGFTVVRTYTAPPDDVLELAADRAAPPRRRLLPRLALPGRRFPPAVPRASPGPAAAAGAPRRRGDWPATSRSWPCASATRSRPTSCAGSAPGRVAGRPRRAGRRRPRRGPRPPRHLRQLPDGRVPAARRRSTS